MYDKIKNNTNNVVLFNIKKYHFTTLNFFNKHAILTYSLKRILLSLAALFVGISIIFLLVRSTTDTNSFLPEAANKYNWSDEQCQTYLKNRLTPIGLYGPIWDQLWHFWYNIIPIIPKEIPTNIKFDERTGQIISVSYQTYFVYFGVTTSSIVGPNQNINDLFNQRIGYSFIFGIIAIAISYLVGIPLGILSAMKKHNMSGNFINTLFLFLYSIPTVILVLGLYVLPVVGLEQSKLFISGSFWSKFWPELTMCILFIPVIVILTRRYFVEELNNEYVNFAITKGVSKNKLFFKHIFRNTSVVLIRTLPMDIGLAVFGFSMISETQWNIPGIGSLIVDALTPGATDPLTILAYVVLSGATVTITSLLSDLLMIKLDPRIKLGGKI